MISRQLLTAGLLMAALLAAPEAARAGQPPVKGPAGPAPGPAQQEEFNDIIRLNSLNNNNVLTPVKVIEDRWDAVVYKMAGVMADGVPCPSETVEGVDYASRPAEYTKAQDLKRSGKFADAVKAFDDGLRKLKATEASQRQYFLLGKIECFAAQRKPEEAHKLVQEMLAASKDNPPRLILEAYLKLCSVWFQSGKFPEAEKACEEAVKFLKDLTKKAGGGGKAALEKYINRYHLEAKLWRIRCLEMQGMVAGPSPEKSAESAYQLFPSQDGAALYPELLIQAEIGLARCMILRKAYAEAIGYLEDREKKGLEGRPAAVVNALPAVYTALGDAYRAKAGSERKDELDYPKARWYYLKVVVQYPTDRTALARAYYGAGLCYEALAQQARERPAEERKRKMFETVAKDYPDLLEAGLVGEKSGGGN
jgi:TolA-binding protein